MAERVKIGSYKEYVQSAIKEFAVLGEERRYMLVDALAETKIEKVLDVGCGAGQEMLPFVEKTAAFCVGVDVAEEVGEVGQKVLRDAGFQNKAVFVRSRGECLPFADESFDVVICRVALPYMDNRKALAEIARVLRSNGYFFLKIHAPRFYFGMVRRRLKTFSAKQLVYPLICLTGGAWSMLFGKQPTGEFWKGKEVFQTRVFLEREFAENNLRIEGFLSDNNVETPSFVIVKN